MALTFAGPLRRGPAPRPRRLTLSVAQVQPLAAHAQQLAQDDLQRRDDRHRDDRAHDAGDLAEEENRQRHDQRVHVHGAAEDQRPQHVAFQQAVDDEVDARRDAVPDPHGEERDQGDARPRDDRSRVRDHAGQAGEDSQRQEERNAVDREEGGGECRVDRADEREPAQVAADRLVDLAQDVLVHAAPFRAGLRDGGVDQAAPEDQHEDHQEGDGDGGGDAAQQVAERVQDRRRRALQHLGEAALGLHQVVAEVKARVDASGTARCRARCGRTAGASWTSPLPCSIAGRDQREAEGDDQTQARRASRSRSRAAA